MSDDEASVRGPDLADRRVVVTGATGGIGLAISKLLANCGASLALVGRRPERLEGLAAGLAGSRHDVIRLDVADPGAWTDARDQLAPDGVVHGLVTAAGELGPIGPIGSWELQSFRHTLDVNVVGTLAPIITLLDALRAGAGSVVTFSGGGATAPLPRYDAYAASKAAVARLTENLSGDLHEMGVRINCVAPGFVLTGIHDATIDAGPELAGAGYFERTERALIEGTGDPPDLAAELTAFLLSDAAAGITGRLLSAKWDPWRDGAFQDRLRTDPHLATLRRIDDQFFTTVPEH